LRQANKFKVVIPDLTESYSSSSDPPEKSIPICTLTNFPNAVHHTIQWAREKFADLFAIRVEQANVYKSTPEVIRQQIASGDGDLEMIEVLQIFLVTDKPSSYKDCVSWARLKFEELFSNNVSVSFNLYRSSSCSSISHLTLSPAQGLPFGRVRRDDPPPSSLTRQM
jgi:hypothetical protein